MLGGVGVRVRQADGEHVAFGEEAFVGQRGGQIAAEEELGAVELGRLFGRRLDAGLLGCVWLECGPGVQVVGQCYAVAGGDGEDFVGAIGVEDCPVDG